MFSPLLQTVVQYYFIKTQLIEKFAQLCISESRYLSIMMGREAVSVKTSSVLTLKEKTT
jgi:hypothetical protein